MTLLTMRWRLGEQRSACDARALRGAHALEPQIPGNFTCTTLLSFSNERMMNDE